MSGNSGREEDRLFQNRIHDLCKAARGRVRYTAFLNEREQEDAACVVSRYLHLDCHLWGGFTSAQRAVLSVYEQGEEPDCQRYPILAVEAVHGKGETLSHRAVLGSLIALGLGRESIGDILPQEGVCRFLLLSSVTPVALDNLRRIGRTGVSCSLCSPEDLAPVQSFEPIRVTVASIRLDSLVSGLTGLSREKSSTLIQSGMVQQNYREILSTTAKFQADDIVTVRGYGKYIVDAIGGPTRKNRLPVECRKYI